MFFSVVTDEMDTSMFIFTSLSNSSWNFMESIGEIFSFSEEPLIRDPIKAGIVFNDFYNVFNESYVNTCQKDFYAREIEHKQLVQFYALNNVSDTDYHLKTKIKALYISVYIQRTNFLYEQKAKESSQSSHFATMRQQLRSLLAHQPIIHDVDGTTLPALFPIDDEEEISLVRFYTAIKEAQKWQTHAKWSSLAFYAASMATGEGIYFGTGGCEASVLNRRKQLFQIIEKEDNPYNKCVKKRKAPLIPSLPLLMTPGVSAAFVGKVGNGKSTLMNALSKKPAQFQSSQLSIIDVPCIGGKSNPEDQYTTTDNIGNRENASTFTILVNTPMNQNPFQPTICIKEIDQLVDPSLLNDSIRNWHVTNEKRGMFSCLHRQIKLYQSKIIFDRKEHRNAGIARYDPVDPMSEYKHRRLDHFNKYSIDGTWDYSFARGESIAKHHGVNQLRHRMRSSKGNNYKGCRVGMHKDQDFNFSTKSSIIMIDRIFDASMKIHIHQEDGLPDDDAIPIQLNMAWG